MKDLDLCIDIAVAIKNANKLLFVTIWKIEDEYYFNFKDRKVGYKTDKFGDNREVIKRC